MDKKSPYKETDIRTLSQDEVFQLRLFNKAKIQPIYVIIGFLQEYFGGYAMDEKIVDGFFVDVFEKALLFTSLCKLFLKENNLENDVMLTRNPTGHSVVESPNICKILKQYYTEKQTDFLSHQCFQLSKEDELFKPPAKNAFFNLN